MRPMSILQQENHSANGEECSSSFPGHQPYFQHKSITLLDNSMSMIYSLPDSTIWGHPMCSNIMVVTWDKFECVNSALCGCTVCRRLGTVLLDDGQALFSIMNMRDLRGTVRQKSTNVNKEPTALRLPLKKYQVYK